MVSCCRGERKEKFQIDSTSVFPTYQCQLEHIHCGGLSKREMSPPVGLNIKLLFLTFVGLLFQIKVRENRSSWLNCVLRDDEAVYWFTVVHILVDWLVSIGRECLDIMRKVEIWSVVTNASRTGSLTDF